MYRNLILKVLKDNAEDNIVKMTYTKLKSQTKLDNNKISQSLKELEHSHQIKLVKRSTYHILHKSKDYKIKPDKSNDIKYHKLNQLIHQYGVNYCVKMMINGIKQNQSYKKAESKAGRPQMKLTPSRRSVLKEYDDKIENHLTNDQIRKKHHLSNFQFYYLLRKFRK